MIQMSFAQLRRAERQHPGILKTIRNIEEIAVPDCPSCGSHRVATVGVGIVGRSILLAGATDRFPLIPNGPVPASFWCRGCRSFFGPPNDDRAVPAAGKKEPVPRPGLLDPHTVSEETIADRSRVEGMCFAIGFGGPPLPNPRWALVKSALAGLDTGWGNSFAILSLEPNTYVQALRGHNGFHLEWRITGETPDDLIHYRASDPDGSTEPALLRKDDGVNEGERRDLLELDQVTHVFRAFFDGKAPPRTPSWRVLDV